MQALSVCIGDRIRHYVICHHQVWENNRGNLRITSFFSSFHKIVKLDASRSQNQGYTLQPEGPRFDKLEEMIEHYHDFNLPKCDAKLTRPHRSWSVQTTWLEKIFKLTKKKKEKKKPISKSSACYDCKQWQFLFMLFSCTKENWRRSAAFEIFTL